MKKLINILCNIGLHYWEYPTDSTRKCQWCPKHEEIDSIEASTMGGIDITWKSKISEI